MSEKKALRGTIWQGAFSGERVFEIALADGKPYRGVVPVHYCWDDAGKPLGRDEPRSKIRGWIACRVLGRIDDVPVVSIPDGEVVPVAEETIIERPAESRVDVPV
jgi:hypothetical protein